MNNLKNFNVHKLLKRKVDVQKWHIIQHKLKPMIPVQEIFYNLDNSEKTNLEELKVNNFLLKTLKVQINTASTLNQSYLICKM